MKERERERERETERERERVSYPCAIIARSIEVAREDLIVMERELQKRKRTVGQRLRGQTLQK